MRRLFACLVIVSLLGVSVAPSVWARTPATFQDQSACRVVSVQDGDTVRLADGHFVRLAGVDAPERDPEQFGARRAAQRVRELLEASDWQVRLEVVGKDRYGRYVADLRLKDGRSVCETLLLEGLVLFYWHKGLPERLSRRLLAAQREALRQRAGNWSAILALPMADEPVIGNRKSRRFFPQHCQDSNKISVRNRQPLASLEEALAQGFSPARQCGVWPLQVEMQGRR